MTEELHYSGVTEEEAEFIQNNAAALSRQAMSQILGMPPSKIQRAVDRMRLSSIPYVGLPEGFGIQFLTPGTQRFKTANGVIHRIPTGTPGIISRTIYTQWDDADGKDTADDEYGDFEVRGKVKDPAGIGAQPRPIQVPHKEAAGPARAKSKADSAIRASRSVQKVPRKRAAVERV